MNIPPAAAFEGPIDEIALALQGDSPQPAGRKGYRYITLSEASTQLDPATYRKYHEVVQRFFAANMHLAVNLDRLLLCVKWDESQHPREPAGSPTGGQFTSGGGGAGTEAKPAEPVEPKLDPKVVEVGGDEWNRAAARRLEREYQAARPAVDKLAQESVGASAELLDEDEDEPAFVPEDWDSLPGSAQELAAEEYVTKNLDSYTESEQNNWYDSGQALDEAKVLTAQEFNDGSETEWVTEAIDEYRTELDARIPYTNDQLLAAISVEYQDGYDGDGKFTVDFNDDELQEPSNLPPPGELLPGLGIEPIKPESRLTAEMRDGLSEAIEQAFNKQADDRKGKLDAPDYLADSAKEYLEEDWDHNLDDEQKFEWVKNHTDIIEQYSTAGTEAAVQQLIVEGLPETVDPLNKTSGRDYRRTQALARYLSVARARQVLEERGIEVDPQHINAQLAAVDARLWKAWKESSTSIYGKLLQVVTAEELGGRLNTKTAQEIDVAEMKKYADRDFEHIGGYAGVRAYTRAKWEVTQYLLDQAGVSELNLYRGLTIEPQKFEKLLAVARHYANREKVGSHEKMPTLDVLRNGAASATTDPSVANGWKAGHKTHVVVRASVPRTAAISIPAYGINVHSEREVVVAGTAWKAWDAWAGRAPEFGDVPLAA